MAKVLESWAFLEMMTPGVVPSLHNEIDPKRIKGTKRLRSVASLEQSFSLLNEVELVKPAKYAKQYSYYMNAYRKNDLVTLLRTYFKSEEEMINPVYDLHYSFTFDVDDKGEYLNDSLFIPYVQLVIDDIKRTGKVSYEDFSERYYLKKKALEEDLAVIFQNGITSEALQKAVEVFNRSYSSVTVNDNRSYVQCLIYNKKTGLQSAKFNSFYLNDLQQILDKGPNKTLHHFINGTPLEMDVDENPEAIKEILSLENLPLGRWPSPVNHRLSLMQQVAVNQILQGNELIYSVNGPPGTGKTTLLKDIFAQLIVERAMKMVSFKDPTKAFTKVGTQDITMGAKDYSYNMFELDPEIAKYAMVVASSNNGAVENISKELPLLTEIIRDARPSEETRQKEVEETGIDPIVYYEYDCAYAEEAKKLAYFTPYAEKMLEEQQAWGMFSAAFGKSANIQKVSQALQSKQDEDVPILTYLSQPLEQISWEIAVKEFNSLKQEIEEDRHELQVFIESMKQAEELEEKLQPISTSITAQKEQEHQLQRASERLEREHHLLKEQLENLPKPGFVKKMLQSMTGTASIEEQEIRMKRSKVLKELSEVANQQDVCEDEIQALQKKEQDIQEKLQLIETQKERYYQEEVCLSTAAFWSPENYQKRQKAVLWQTHELNFKRGMLFLKALQVHKVFLHRNHQQLKVSLTMLQNLRSINLNIEENKKNLSRMWKTLPLLFPIMSTTFASFGSMYRGLDADVIDYLFIDEAGQASPQQAAGALWRSKHAIIVGDPIQIEPVVTIDETMLSDIRKNFGVSEQYIGPTASVQTMADYANPIGTYKGEGDQRERIGIPLWVHRRCIEPMFSISNEIAYENKMVLANDKVGKGEWFDIKGEAIQAQYVKEQGDFMVERLKQHFKEVEEEMPSIFVITPFTAVKEALIRRIMSQLGKEVKGIRKWVQASIGTVHTFQGKEADIVYFVTGTDITTDGAANWSCAKPNLLNVAATRAKKEFYVVGELSRFKTKPYYDVIVEQFSHITKP